MGKITWKPGTMVYPVPAAMVSCGTLESPNIITIAWTGTICSTPPMTYVSVRKERYSYDLIKEGQCFVINLTTKALVHATDFCGVKSGKDIDKFKTTGLTPTASAKVSAPSILESPVNIECVVKEIKELGSHDMFLAEVVSVTIDDQYLDKTGKLRLDLAEMICYSHGAYYSLGSLLGTFGYSVAKKNKSKRPSKKRRPKK
ncbi:flavin reductase family protein [Fusibacter ferrireducens]|uniref:Flavin reductase family protein n=1 Tax=Fusibacter ferrireducens TaxID=2785058 RepID=A0ABR9ZWJ5_9FIRM|nr:flavin reductase family protein [Fusibacter ferrireducens]MBF4694336.1 flavin reductase family protein [Fusibacter ferrireducens]